MFLRDFWVIVVMYTICFREEAQFELNTLFPDWFAPVWNARRVVSLQEFSLVRCRNSEFSIHFVSCCLVEFTWWIFACWGLHFIFIIRFNCSFHYSIVLSFLHLSLCPFVVILCLMDGIDLLSLWILVFNISELYKLIIFSLIIVLETGDQFIKKYSNKRSYCDMIIFSPEYADKWAEICRNSDITDFFRVVYIMQRSNHLGRQKTFHAVWYWARGHRTIAVLMKMAQSCTVDDEIPFNWIDNVDSVQYYTDVQYS